MQVHSDYEDLFKILNAEKIKYLVVGAYAVMYHSQPRYTKDIDVWIIPELNDVNRIYKALKKFGAPLVGIKPENFNDKKMIFQIGIVPVRIDILLELPGVTSELAWRHKKRTLYGKTPVYILGKEDLIAVKTRAGRPQDKIDIDNLKKS